MLAKIIALNNEQRFVIALKRMSDPFNLALLSRWEKHFRAILLFRDKYPERWVYSKEIFRRERIGDWVNAQRNAYAKGTLSPRRIELLNAIDFCWSSTEDRWQEMFELFKHYKAEYFTVEIPINKKYKNKNLGIWCAAQRYYRKRGRLSAERQQLLNSVGFIWSKYDGKWKAKYHEVCEYFIIHAGDLPAYSTKLGQWVYNQTRKGRSRTYSADRIELLRKIGII